MVRRSAGPAPGDEARSRHKEASAAIQSNLQTAHIFTEGIDRRLVDDLAGRHTQYLAAAGNAWGEASEESLPLRVFDQSAPTRRAPRLHYPRWRLIRTRWPNVCACRHWGCCRCWSDIQTRVLIGGPVLFALGLVLVGAVWRMQRSEQRRGTTRLVQDAYAANWEERRFRGVVDTAPDPMLICAGPGNVIYHKRRGRDRPGRIRPRSWKVSRS